MNHVFPVSSAKVLALEAKMAKLGLRDQDFSEQFIRSGKSGGQNVNKVATCVVIRHLPTGLCVRCQTERSQGMNRFLAKRLLVEKIEQAQLGALSQKQMEFEKIRRQKRRRSRRAKNRMLDDKKNVSNKKKMRRSVQNWDGL